MSRIDIEDQWRHWVGRLRAGDTHLPDGEQGGPGQTGAPRGDWYIDLDRIQR